MHYTEVKLNGDRIIRETGKIMIGKELQTRLILTAMLADGHVLLEDLPGSGKTTLVKCLALTMDAGYKRIQFTPDLLPSDVTGMNIFDQKSGGFRYLNGPVFTNILLADEINRAIPRTQSALLEAMEEKQISIDGDCHPLPSPFLVMATQNPVDTENTFALPAAQMDRFFFRLSLGYPTPEQEMEMIGRLGEETDFSKIDAVVDINTFLDMQKAAASVYVSDDLKSYIVQLTDRTRHDPLIRQGASPRASRCLYRGARAYAALDGRDYCIPEDIQLLAPYILIHRITLSPQARFSGKDAAAYIRELIAEVPVPPLRETIIYGQK